MNKRWDVMTCILATVVLCAAVATATGQVVAQPQRLGNGALDVPAAELYALSPAVALPTIELPTLDRAALAVEDEARTASGLPPRFAIPHPTDISPATDGLWQRVDQDYDVWRLRIVSADAPSINLGFTLFDMPTGGRMLVYASDDSYVVGPYTAVNNKPHGELWTPVVLSDDIVIEVLLPRRERAALGLTLTYINVGYRGFGELLTTRSGSCNNDVVCPEGDDWREEIPSVGVISTGGSTFCTGFMVNNTAEDETPYFMTANHCGISTGNDQSLVVYWNFESPNCGDQCCGSLSQNQNGSLHLASYASSDFTLVLLDDAPDPAWNVSWAGWDRTSADPTSAVAIHHPNTDEKSISFEYNPTSTTSYLGTGIPGDGTHIRVTDWDDGTTEPGSSGSPLFDQNHRVVGQLHGGYAACGNNDSDWYGRFSVSWSHGLSTYLDSGNTGATFVDTLAPWAGGMKVNPQDEFHAEGVSGGPFTPASKNYSVQNKYNYPIDYQVTTSAPWLTITNGSGTIPADTTISVIISVNASANALGNGNYADTISFENLTDHDGDLIVPATLRVGVPVEQYGWTLESDPGWAISGGEWAFGQPAGLGGDSYGSPDPSTGHTGSYVYGVNLNGDYSLTPAGPYYVTLGPIDMTDMTEISVRYYRRLNTDYVPYTYATVDVSSDGSSWETLWSNGELAMNENAWTAVTHAVPAAYDDSATFYVRWGYKVNSFAFAYSGWNFDDVQIYGLDTSAPPAVGDLNCDGTVDLFDIDPFVLALTSAAHVPAFDEYLAAYPDCDPLLADTNDDGEVDLFDIDGFVGLVAP